MDQKCYVLPEKLATPLSDAKNIFYRLGFNTLQVCEQVPADYESSPAYYCLAAALRARLSP
jgi:hypothetical protein